MGVSGKNLIKLGQTFVLLFMSVPLEGFVKGGGTVRSEESYRGWGV